MKWMSEQLVRTKEVRNGRERRIEGNLQSGKERKEQGDSRARLELWGEASKETERETVVAAGTLAQLLCLPWGEGRDGSQSASTWAYSSPCVCPCVRSSEEARNCPVTEAPRPPRLPSQPRVQPSIANDPAGETYI